MQTGRQCPDGWDFVPNGEDGKCMNFYLGGESHLPWYDGFHYCQSIGARMMMIENELEQKFIAQEPFDLVGPLLNFGQLIDLPIRVKLTKAFF